MFHIAKTGLLSCCLYMISGIIGESKANGMIGRRGTKTNGANLSCSQLLFVLKNSATKDGIFSVIDGEECKHCSVHNGRFPSIAHSNMRTSYSFTKLHIFCVAQSRKTEAVYETWSVCMKAKNRYAYLFACIACLNRHIHALHRHLARGQHFRLRRQPE